MMIKDSTNANQDKFSSFITQYCQNHKIINNIMNNHWHILKEDPYLNNSISTKPCIIHRRARTLKSVPAPSHFRNIKVDDPIGPTRIKNGSYKCHHDRCKCCHNISDKTLCIQSNVINKIFNIKTRMDCGSSYFMLSSANVDYNMGAGPPKL